MAERATGFHNAQNHAKSDGHRRVFAKETQKMDMTIEQAQHIVHWRERADDGIGLSWRAVAYVFMQTYPDESIRWQVLHTQPCGQTLCQVAENTLKQAGLLASDYHLI